MPTAGSIIQGLEKSPLTKIPAEPTELLDKTRYQFCRKQLSCEKEDELNRILDVMSSKAAKRGILVKPFFEDASRDANSVRLINHVTPQQFKQVCPLSTGIKPVVFLYQEDSLELLTKCCCLRSIIWTGGGGLHSHHWSPGLKLIAATLHMCLSCLDACSKFGRAA